MNKTWTLVNPLTRNTRPQQFLQQIVQSDGSTFTLKTSSPRPLQVLTKDTTNHLLWNPERASGLEEGSAELARFATKYGGVKIDTDASLNGLGFAFSEPVVMVKKVVAVVDVVAQKKKGKK